MQFSPHEKQPQILEFLITSVLQIIPDPTPENKARFLPNKFYFDQNWVSVLFPLLPAPLLTLSLICHKKQFPHRPFCWMMICFLNLQTLQGNNCGRFSCSLNFLFWCLITIFMGFRCTWYKPFCDYLLCSDVVIRKSHLLPYQIFHNK